MKITAKMLTDKGACPDQVKIFRKAWPNGALNTLANCHKAVKLGLDLDWAASNLLSAPARKVYVEATAQAWKVYVEATAQARKVYVEATAQAWKVCNEAMAQAFYRAAKVEACGRKKP